MRQHPDAMAAPQLHHFMKHGTQHQYRHRTMLHRPHPAPIPRRNPKLIRRGITRLQQKRAKLKVSALCDVRITFPIVLFITIMSLARIMCALLRFLSLSIVHIYAQRYAIITCTHIEIAFPFFSLAHVRPPFITHSSFFNFNWMFVNTTQSARNLLLYNSQLCISKKLLFAQMVTLCALSDFRNCNYSTTWRLWRMREGNCNWFSWIKSISHLPENDDKIRLCQWSIDFFFLPSVHQPFVILINTFS